MDLLFVDKYLGVELVGAPPAPGSGQKSFSSYPLWWAWSAAIWCGLVCIFRMTHDAEHLYISKKIGAFGRPLS